MLTAGESHGFALSAILEGMPPGIAVSHEELVAEQARRRWCYGRGGRAAIEKDEIRITGGVYMGKTTGAPIGLFIPNRDYENWEGKYAPIWVPRPGHADFSGALKHGFTDMRPVAERASARETAARVACGYFAKKLLEHEGIRVVSWVSRIGSVQADLPFERGTDDRMARELGQAALKQPTRCPDAEASAQMVSAIDHAASLGDSLGGVFELAATGMCAGLGSYTHYDRKLDAAIAAGVMSINGVKAVEFGEGFGFGSLTGSRAHDEIVSLDPKTRPTNRAGGIEGGVSNGSMVFLRAAHKPIPMLKNVLRSVDMRSGEPAPAHAERSDVCAVGCAAVVGESMLALALADAWLERYGHDGVTGFD